jgi:hypothetical protein
MQTLSIRPLNSITIAQVSGGLSPGPGYTPPLSVLFPVLGPIAGVGGAFAAGYAAGTLLNNTFGISTWIVDQLE